LYALVGTNFGSGNNSTTFNLPNAAGKVLGVVASGSHTLGSSAGAETHTLSTSEMPAHQHTYQDAYFAENYNNEAQVYGTGSGTDYDNRFYYRQVDGSYSRTPGDLPTSSTGSGTAFSVMQPTLFIGNTFIIYSGVV
jgi:microcystin-dependent protein